MKTAAISLLIGVCVLLQSALTVSAVSLSVSPNLQQFFSGPSSVYLTCVDDGQIVDGWTVKRTRGGLTEDCGAAAGFGEFKSYTCILSDISEPDSASYWCETSSGQRSDQINITVTEKHLILEVPALPVRTGSDVTLRCRQRNGGTVQGYFSIKGSSVGPKREHSITNIQQSDEGLYWCSTDDGGKSPQSFLRVRGQIPPVNSPLFFTLSIHHPASPSLPPSLLVTVVASLVSVVLLVLVVGGVLFFCKGNKRR
ncbi:low affinity immunoglobulin gamma Fc region receptor II-b-like [Astatotilapia calliptera]|uniref:low affinity immunoglobulin gamma Fc region receptor II-b-like n=1 Tax=Astatotilapia calliptera TaxID=8154 RepID=UPI000E41F0FE|nr:low affinity immunoglobulin gamma Fc region receptor II-b-like [Astatotilapia calliptera]